MNTVVDIVRSWAASDSSVNPTKEILEWVEQRNATVKAVSYTHLDVYKRQVIFLPHFSAFHQ